jgi:hypothetical protein
MHDGGRGNPVEQAASLELGLAGSQYVPDPLAIPSVRQRDCETVWRFKDIHGRAVFPP